VKAAAGGAGPPSGQIRPYCAASHARHQKIFTITIVIKIRRTMINVLMMMMMTIVANMIDHSNIDSFNTDSNNDNDNEDENEHENENENDNVDDDDTDDNNHD